MKKSSIIALILVLPLLFFSTTMSACKSNDTTLLTTTAAASTTTQTPTTVASTTATSATQVPVSTTTVPAPTTTAPTQPVSTGVPAFNPLTGLALKDAARITARPIAIMINNIKIAVPQLGINSADLYYEMVVEGGITRMMVVFADPMTVPELGSVRSARHDYVDLAGGHDAIYVHAGGSDLANNQMNAQKTSDIDMLTYGTAFWRDAEWARTRGTEHSVRTDSSHLIAAIAALKFRDTVTGTPQPAFSFLDGEPQPAASVQNNPASTVSVEFSNYTTSTFKYDASTKRYSKYEFGGPQVDLATGIALNVTNVVILRTNIRDLSGTNLMDADLTSGTGYYVSQGARVPIRWRKGATKDPIKLMREDGSPLQINRGKTFICIQDDSHSLKFS